MGRKHKTETCIQYKIGWTMTDGWCGTEEEEEEEQHKGQREKMKEYDKKRKKRK